MSAVRNAFKNLRKFYVFLVNSKVFFLILIIALFLLTLAARDVIGKTLVQ